MLKQALIKYHCLNLGHILEKYPKFIIYLFLFFVLLIYFNRFLIPDFSYDTLNYHFFNGSRIFSFWKFSNIEFYPTGLFNFSSVLDGLAFFSYSLVGYRLGTLVFVLMLVVSVYFFKKFLELFDVYVENSIVAAVLFVNVFYIYDLLFQVATYFTDIGIHMFVSVLIYSFFKYLKCFKFKYNVFFSVVSGILFLSKMTTMIYIVPLYGVWFVYIIGKKQFGEFIKLLISLIIFLSIIFPFLLSNYLQTSNPVFPFFNSIFKSPYFEKISFSNDNYGGLNTTDKLLWPITSLFQVERIGEARTLFVDYKFNIALPLSLFLYVLYLFKFKSKKPILSLFLSYFVISYLLWTMLFGYARYAISIEAFVYLLLIILQKEFSLKKIHSQKIKYLIYSVICVICVGSLISNFFLTKFNLKYDLSWRPSFFTEGKEYLKNLPNLFVSTISVSKYMPKPSVFVNCDFPSIGYYSLTEYNNLPVMLLEERLSSSILSHSSNADGIQNGFLKFDTTSYVTIVTKKGLDPNYDTCMSTIKKKGFVVREEYKTSFLGYIPQQLSIIFFSK